MKVSFSFLFLLFVKNCRSGDVLSEEIPDQWKKYPPQKPMNNQKNINNSKLIYPSDTSAPTFHALPVNTQFIRPVNLHMPGISPKLHIYMSSDNETLPKSIQESLDQTKLINPMDVSKEEEYKKDEVHTDKALKFDEAERETLHNNILKTFVKASEQHSNNNKQDETDNGYIVLFYNNTNLEIEKAKKARKIEVPKTDFNNALPGNSKGDTEILNTISKDDQMNKNNNNMEYLTILKILTNRCPKNQRTKNVDNSKGHENDTNRKSNIEMVINHDTNNGTDDLGAEIIITYNEDRELINDTNNTVQDFCDQNNQDPTYNVQEVLPYYYGGFTTNQYTKSLSDKGNYSNIYQLGIDTKQYNKYLFYGLTHNIAGILPNVIRSDLGKFTVYDYLIANYFWRSLRMPDYRIRNKSKNLTQFLNYCRPGIKKFNQCYFINRHSYYRNLNNFKPHYPWYVYNGV